MDPRLRAASPAGRDDAVRWTVVLPLKGGREAKSRLRAALGAGPGVGDALATAMALDCLSAVVACRAVDRALVVTADRDLGTAANALGAHVVPESSPGAGLAAAVRDGIRAAGGPTAVLLGDLPALRPDDLARALTAAASRLYPQGPHPMAFVPDAEGTGTVLLAAADVADLAAAFGPGSAAAHTRLGAARLDLALPRLRRDVDVVADLDVAAGWGLGPRTSYLLATAPSVSGVVPAAATGTGD
jgi:2-phospho-L-lactate guanylyltransferase